MTEAKGLMRSTGSNCESQISGLSEKFRIADSLPWSELSGPLARAEDTLARCDELLRLSPVREGWIARTHLSDAAASVWIEGELVDLDELLLHDAGMDLRTATQELTRADAVLRVRRRIAAAEADWAFSRTGLAELRGRLPPAEGRACLSHDGEDPDDSALELSEDRIPDDTWAEIDALMKRTERKPERLALIYGYDWEEEMRFQEWCRGIEQTADLPPVLAAAVAAQAWDEINPLRHQTWLGRLLVPALLRSRLKTRTHLCCLNIGLRSVLREQRGGGRQPRNLLAWVNALTAAAEEGRKDHDRWLLRRDQLERKLVGRRSTSHLRALIELVMAKPIVSAVMIAKELRVTPRAAEYLVAELGLRDVTGRRSGRAWGVT